MRIWKSSPLWLAFATIATPLIAQAASIQGKIVDAETDVGIRSPALFYSSECGVDYEGMAWSDSDGYFQKDDLPDGKDIFIMLLPGNAGLTSYINEYYDGAPTCDTATPVDPDNLPLEPEDVDNQTSTQIFKLKLHPPTGGGTIRGRVTSNGTALANLQIQAYTAPCSGYISYGKTYTDAEGYYQLEHMPSGNIYMKACPTCTVGFDQTNQWWTDQPQNTDDCNLSAAIEVSEGSEHNNIDFALTSGATISGTLFNEDGTPLSDTVVVHAYKNDPCNGDYVGGSAAGYFGPAGYFTIDQLPAGTMYVRTDCNNRPTENYVEKYYDGGSGSILCQEAVAIELGDNENVSGIDIIVPKGGIIQGQILSDEEPLGRTTVSPYLGIYPDGFWLQLPSYTNDDGTFSIKHLPEGDITLQASPPIGFKNVWWSDENPAGVDIGSEATHLEVFPGETTYDIDFSLIFYADLDTDFDVDGNDLYLLVRQNTAPAPHVISQFAAHFGS